MAPHPCYQGSRGEAHTLGKARSSVSSAASPGLCLSHTSPCGWPICQYNIKWKKKKKNMGSIVGGFWQSHGYAVANSAHYLHGGNKSRVCCLN